MNIDDILTALQERRIGPGEAEAMLGALQSGPEDRASQEPASAAPAFHPLLQQDISDGSARRFASEFTGREFFLADHVIQGRKIFPAVAYLEMARVAVSRELARLGSGLPSREEKPQSVILEHVTWEQPVTVEEKPANVYLTLQSSSAGEIHYEIHTSPSATPEQEVKISVHSRGSARMGTGPVARPLDLQDLRMHCVGEPLTATACYEVFEALGVMYGPAFKSLQRVSAGIDEDGQRFALADFKLPLAVLDTCEDYVLHPSLMDAAFQAPIALMLDGNSDGSATRPRIPFALEEVHILRACPVEGVVVVREASESTGRVQKFNIDVCGLNGQVCVRLKHFSARVIESSSRLPDLHTIMLAPKFETDPFIGQSADSNYSGRWIVLCEIAGGGYVEALQAATPEHECVELPQTQDGLAERFERHAQQLLVLVQRILSQRQAGRQLVQLVVPAGGDGWLFSGLGGMLKTVQLENPKVQAQVIGIEAGMYPHALRNLLEQNAMRQQDTVVRYLSGVRHVERLVAIETALPSANLN